MKITPLSHCERLSVLHNIREKRRLDGREMLEMRSINIHFGKDYGCCTVTLGETRVIAQVSSEVVKPTPSRPNEGRLSISVHLSPMAASHFEIGRFNEVVDECQQILDRNIKESKCVDLESLCIMAEESVWQFKVDVTILNHAGNVGDACNIAAVAALRHFHRPDVTVEEDGRVTIHTKEEREFIPTFLKKIPVCVTYGIFANENTPELVTDPTEKEERVMAGKLSVGLNPHGEITSLIFPGKVCIEKSMVLKAVHKAFISAKAIAENITKLIDDELKTLKTDIFLKPNTGFIGKLKSDRFYNEQLMANRLNCLNKFDKSDLKPEEIEMKDGTLEVASQPMTTNESSSEDEFSEEYLSKNIDEIRKIKKK